MSRGTPALIGLLALASLAMVAIVGGLVALFALSEGNAFWWTLMRTLDAGTMSGDQGSGLEGLGLLATIGGVVVVSALIGILNTGLDTRIAELRKGRSRVVERGHTVVLG